ncbi:MAG TPA: hypothetical protein VFA41_01625 [Ktedonobacteraceae bacterium]|jgi:hypothetical protein|nr:hypothetical protein [Ktedonobacteraceae bacterium]
MAEKTKISVGPKRSDPLAGHYGQPLLVSDASSGTYLGRVILELYDIHKPQHPEENRTDSHNLRYMVDPVDGLAANELMQRIATALLSDVSSSTHPNASRGLLAEYKQPLIGEDGPNDHYLGRIVTELYRIADTDVLQYTVDPAAGLTASELAQRVATAFSNRAKTDKLDI